MTNQSPAARALQQARMCAQVCDQYRGQNTVVLDLTEVTPLFDYFVVTTGNNRRQMHAIAEEVDRMMNEQGSKRLGIEGYQASQWIVQDYGDIVLHVFTPDARALYDLENLWADAAKVDWQQTESVSVTDD